MPRTPPPADLDPSQIPALIGSRKREPILSVELAVVTPMFGGGATPRVTDPDVPIRGSSIRGHLRFWWRACKARGFASVEELHREESRIWGKSAAGKRDDPVGPSDIDVSVEILDPGRENPGFVAQQRNSALAYALFPFQENRRQGVKAATAREHVRFRLILSSAPHVVEEEQRATLEQAAEAALWAWVMFGGVGARTRRGCGSLVCLTPDDRFRPGRNLSSWLGGAVNKHTVRGTGCPSVPGLFAQLVLGPRPVLPMAAWTLAVDAMRQFRQGIGVGRQPSGQGRQGKSNWPEAETIRAAVTRQGPAAHPAAPYFPRADLGLPIIFQQMQLGRADPTVQAAADGATRMASPIILKPLVLSEHQAFPMALRLTGPSLGEAGSPPVELVGPGGRRLTPADLQDPVKSAATPPIAAKGKLSAREAFMAFARDFWNRRAEGQR